jgi:hypothetical protein
MVSLLLKLGSRWRCVVSFMFLLLYALVATLLPTEQEHECIPQSVCTLRRRGKYLALPGIKA